ncbi:electron transport complex subunit RsxC [Marinilactibacillus sp. XAAS-LB27]|uniref:electron transport complex subunit RsxC n=1 Tax=Marinilactibacillus sp. XAAS-LB27 TaxID=3114538 RepID=UPI002E190EB0|nr:electron transport complex subunit RsxC [Marinilactibacillus sp. XAAS-LB27]
MQFSFMRKQGGSHPEENKDRTRKLPIVDATVPKVLIFPVSMHIGAPAKPIVEVGDQVKVGQMIAEAGGFISANIYSSVSGEVIAVEKRPSTGGDIDSVIIKNDFEYTKDEPIVEPGRSMDMTDDEIIETVRKAGIVGMGGATFPTAVKLSPPPGMTIDTLIINGAECEPYSTSDNRVMIEYSEEIVNGINVIRKLFPKLKKVYIGIEDNKPNALKALEEATKNYRDVIVQPLKTMYPQGSEKNLIQTMTGREVPPGGLPAEVRCVVMNTSTLRACYRACEYGEPLTERIVSVSGTPIKEPKNLLVKIGTPMDSLIEDCGGFSEVPGKVLSGGPMMGKPVSDLGISIIKGTTAITVLTPAEADEGEEKDCIMCSECLNVCPVSLQPILISDAFDRGNLQKAKELGAMDCIECGNCSFICPSKIPLLDNIRAAKAAIKEQEAG